MSTRTARKKIASPGSTSSSSSSNEAMKRSTKKKKKVTLNLGDGHLSRDVSHSEPNPGKKKKKKKATKANATRGTRHSEHHGHVGDKDVVDESIMNELTLDLERFEQGIFCQRAERYRCRQCDYCTAHRHVEEMLPVLLSFTEEQQGIFLKAMVEASHESLLACLQTILPSVSAKETMYAKGQRDQLKTKVLNSKLTTLLRRTTSGRSLNSYNDLPRRKSAFDFAPPQRGFRSSFVRLRASTVDLMGGDDQPSPRRSSRGSIDLSTTSYSRHRRRSRGSFSQSQHDQPQRRRSSLFDYDQPASLAQIFRMSNLNTTAAEDRKARLFAASSGIELQAVLTKFFDWYATLCGSTSPEAVYVWKSILVKLGHQPRLFIVQVVNTYLRKTRHENYKQVAHAQGQGQNQNQNHSQSRSHRRTSTTHGDRGERLSLDFVAGEIADMNAALASSSQAEVPPLSPSAPPPSRGDGYSRRSSLLDEQQGWHSAYTDPTLHTIEAIQEVDESTGHGHGQRAFHEISIHNGSSRYYGGGNEYGSRRPSMCLDFVEVDERFDMIVFLPRPLALFVLSFLPEKSRNQARLVSRAWNNLVKIVTEDKRLQQEAEDVTLFYMRHYKLSNKFSVLRYIAVPPTATPATMAQHQTTGNGSNVSNDATVERARPVSASRTQPTAEAAPSSTSALVNPTEQQGSQLLNLLSRDFFCSAYSVSKMNVRSYKASYTMISADYGEGKFWFTGGSSGDVVVRDISTGDAIGVLEGHVGHPTGAVIFSSPTRPPQRTRLSGAIFDPTIQQHVFNDGKIPTDSHTIMSPPSTPSFSSFANEPHGLDTRASAEDTETGMSLHERRLSATGMVSNRDAASKKAWGDRDVSDSDATFATTHNDTEAGQTPKGPYTFIATCGKDKSVRLWDPKTFRCEYILQGHGTAIVAISACRELNTIVTASTFGRVNLWNIARKKPSVVLKARKRLIDMAMFQRRCALIEDDGYVEVAEFGKNARSLKHIIAVKNEYPEGESHSCVDLSDHFLCVGGTDGSLRVYCVDLFPGIVKAKLAQLQEEKERQEEEKAVHDLQQASRNARRASRRYSRRFSRRSSSMRKSSDASARKRVGSARTPSPLSPSNRMSPSPPQTPTARTRQRRGTLQLSLPVALEDERKLASLSSMALSDTEANAASPSSPIDGSFRFSDRDDDHSLSPPARRRNREHHSPSDEHAGKHTPRPPSQSFGRKSRRSKSQGARSPRTSVHRRQSSRRLRAATPTLGEAKTLPPEELLKRYVFSDDEVPPQHFFVHQQAVTRVKYGYSRVLTSCKDGFIRLWSLARNECVYMTKPSISNEPIFNFTCFDVRGLMIATSSNLSMLTFLTDDRSPLCEVGDDLPDIAKQIQQQDSLNDGAADYNFTVDSNMLRIDFVTVDENEEGAKQGPSTALAEPDAGRISPALNAPRTHPYPKSSLPFNTPMHTQTPLAEDDAAEIEAAALAQLEAQEKSKRRRAVGITHSPSFTSSNPITRAKPQPNPLTAERGASAVRPSSSAARMSPGIHQRDLSAYDRAILRNQALKERFRFSDRNYNNLHKASTKGRATDERKPSRSRSLRQQRPATSSSSAAFRETSPSVATQRRKTLARSLPAHADAVGSEKAHLNSLHRPKVANASQRSPCRSPTSEIANAALMGQRPSTSSRDGRLSPLSASDTLTGLMQPTLEIPPSQSTLMKPTAMSADQDHTDMEDSARHGRPYSPRRSPNLASPTAQRRRDVRGNAIGNGKREVARTHSPSHASEHSLRTSPLSPSRTPSAVDDVRSVVVGEKGSSRHASRWQRAFSSVKKQQRLAKSTSALPPPNQDGTTRGIQQDEDTTPLGSACPSFRSAVEKVFFSQPSVSRSLGPMSPRARRGYVPGQASTSMKQLPGHKPQTRHGNELAHASTAEVSKLIWTLSRSLQPHSSTADADDGPGPGHNGYDGDDGDSRMGLHRSTVRNGRLGNGRGPLGYGNEPPNSLPTHQQRAMTGTESGGRHRHSPFYEPTSLVDAVSRSASDHLLPPAQATVGRTRLPTSRMARQASSSSILSGLSEDDYLDGHGSRRQSRRLSTGSLPLRGSSTSLLGEESSIRKPSLIFAVGRGQMARDDVHADPELVAEAALTLSPARQRGIVPRGSGSNLMSPALKISRQNSLTDLRHSIMQ